MSKKNNGDVYETEHPAVDSLDNDFGFSFVEETAGEEEEVSDAFLATVEARDSIFSFLDKLAANPTAETIKWPGRAEQISKFKEKLEHLFDRAMG